MCPPGRALPRDHPVSKKRLTGFQMNADFRSRVSADMTENLCAAAVRDLFTKM